MTDVIAPAGPHDRGGSRRSAFGGPSGTSASAVASSRPIPVKGWGRRSGFEAGPKKADPEITTLRTYANDFLNAARCRSAALGLLGKRAGAPFNVAGACVLGTLQVAKEKHVWGIGVDVAQSFLGSQILTSVLKRFDVQIYDTVRALVQGQLETAGNAVWDLRNGGVALGKISPKVPRRFLARLDEIRRQLRAGRITIPRVPS